MKCDAVLFGASGLGRLAGTILVSQYNIIGFCDNDSKKWGTEFEGIQVFPPDKLKEIKAKVIITSCYSDEIALQLTEMGIDDYFIFTTGLTRYVKGTLSHMQDMIRKDQEFMEIYSFVKDYTMTSIEKIYALYQSVKYIITNNIPGDFVECGVWRGGSAMAMALTLKTLGAERDIYLYDLFGAPVLETLKVEDYKGDIEVVEEGEQPELWKVSLAEVKNNLKTTGYPDGRFVFAEGPVEKTLPLILPSQISLLRLDTDFYESTYLELKYLYPKLSFNGVLIIDDYGQYFECKRAVDQFFDENRTHVLLNRIDLGGRIGIKVRTNI